MAEDRDGGCAVTLGQLALECHEGGEKCKQERRQKSSSFIMLAGSI
jgi:hypothetical protein